MTQMPINAFEEDDDNMLNDESSSDHQWVVSQIILSHASFVLSSSPSFILPSSLSFILFSSSSFILSLSLSFFPPFLEDYNYARIIGLSYKIKFSFTYIDAP